MKQIILPSPMKKLLNKKKNTPTVERKENSRANPPLPRQNANVLPNKKPKI